MRWQEQIWSGGLIQNEIPVVILVYAYFNDIYGPLNTMWPVKTWQIYKVSGTDCKDNVDEATHICFSGHLACFDEPSTNPPVTVPPSDLLWLTPSDLLWQCLPRTSCGCDSLGPPVAVTPSDLLWLWLPRTSKVAGDEIEIIHLWLENVTSHYSKCVCPW